MRYMCTLNIISIQKSGIFPFESLFGVIPQKICCAITIMSRIPPHRLQRSRIVAIDTKWWCKQKISLPYGLTGLPNFGVINLASRVILYWLKFNQSSISFRTEISAFYPVIFDCSLPLNWTKQMKRDYWL